jgi:hypothetical protein
MSGQSGFVRPVVSAVCGLLVVAAPRPALACPVCFGQSDAPLALAMNQGIFFMLVVVVCMLGAFAAFFVRLARRQRMFADETHANEYAAKDTQEGIV